MRAGSLVTRDRALASILGAIGPDFGSEFGDDFGDEDEVAGDFGDDDDDDVGSDFGAAVKKRKSAQASLAKWNQMQMATARRTRVLAPNKNSQVDVEHYTFPLSEAITIGTLSVFSDLSSTPDTRFRPQRMTTNAPCPMFAFLSNIKASNVSANIGTGQEDAYTYNANAVGQSLDLPTLSPANRVSISGNYTGFIPPGFTNGLATYFTVSFKGPSVLAGG